MTNTENLVLLFGLPRSGTTWIGKAFDSHPDVHYRHETDTHLSLNNIFPLCPQSNTYDQYENKLKQYIDEELLLCSQRICGNGTFFKKNYNSLLASISQNIKIHVTRNIERVTGKKIYWKHIQPANNEKLVWKSIESLGRLGVIANVFPKSKSIIIMRNPCGYIASILRGEKQNKFSNYISANDYNILDILLKTEYGKQLGITLDELKNKTAIERLAYKWLLFYQKVLDDTKNLKNCCVVRYEDICASPINGFKQLYQFSDLNWTKQTDDFIHSSISTNSNSYYEVQRIPLTAAMKWKEELSSKQIEEIQSVVKDHSAGKLYFEKNKTKSVYNIIEIKDTAD